MGSQIGAICCSDNSRQVGPPLEIIAPKGEPVKQSPDNPENPGEMKPKSPKDDDEEQVPYDIFEEPQLTEQQKKLYKGQQPSQTESGQKCYKIMATECKQLYEYLIYCGKFKKGKAHGPCRIHTSDGYYLEGTFQNGVLGPQVSKFVYPDGTYFTGTATGSLPHFRINYVTGELYYADGSYYKGGFLGNKMHGNNCTYIDSKTKITLKGEWEEDLAHGRISQYQNGMLKWQGEYSKGQRAHGRQFSTMGAQLVTKYSNGVPIGTGEVFFGQKRLKVVHHQGDLVTCQAINQTRV